MSVHTFQTLDACLAVLAASYRTRNTAGFREAWADIVGIISGLLDGLGPDSWRTIVKNLLKLLFPDTPVLAAENARIDREWVAEALRSDHATTAAGLGSWGDLLLFMLEFLLRRGVGRGIQEAESQSVGAWNPNNPTDDGGRSLRHDGEHAPAAPETIETDEAENGESPADEVVEAQDEATADQSRELTAD